MGLSFSHEEGAYPRVAALLIFLCLCVPVKAQQQQPRRVVINFLAAINDNTINALLRTVAEQAKTAQSIRILISSGGGDTSSAFTAYNILRNLPVEIETFNNGRVDSAAILLYAAGDRRYSLPGPGTRFLIHGNRLTARQNTQMNLGTLESNVDRIKSVDQMIAQVLTSIAPAKAAEIQNAISTQTILTPEEALEWGIVHEIKSNVIEPGAVFVAINDLEDTSTQEEPIGFSFSD